MENNGDEDYDNFFEDEEIDGGGEGDLRGDDLVEAERRTYGQRSKDKRRVRFADAYAESDGDDHIPSGYDVSSTDIITLMDLLGRNRDRSREADGLPQQAVRFSQPGRNDKRSTAKGSATNLEALNLSAKQLDRIPRDELKPENAAKYGILKLSDNPALQVTEEIKNFEKLQELHASGCGIKRLPAELASLKSLHKLCLFNNPLMKAFPEVVLSLSALRELNLGQCDLPEVPKDITKLNQLEKLHLRGNRRLRKIPVEVFSMTTLRELNIGQCGLTGLPEEISKLKQLEKLHLFGNSRLRSIPASVFLLTSLTEINVGCCGLTDIPTDIAKLVRLSHLHLRENKDLKQIPSPVFMLLTLKELSVAHCGLQEIPEDIGKLTKLEKLHVHGNKELPTLPKAVFGLTQLRELNACYCSLKSLDDIGQLKGLENLHLRGNEELRQLPEGVLALTELRELNVAQCGLAVIPATISQLTKLKKLHVSGNPSLDELPKSLTQLARLEELSLGNCGLQSKSDLGGVIGEGPPSLDQLKQLKKLHLSGCGGLQRRFRDISSMTTLKEIDLSNCGLTAMPFSAQQLNDLARVELGSNELQTQGLAEIFKLKKLEELGISCCGLMEIPDLGDVATHLKKLDLHGNRIGKISPTVFRQLEQLQELNVAGCQLAELPEEISELKQLIVLNASENQLTTLPESLSGLALIEALDISSNSMSQLPPVVTALAKLKTLNISCSSISALSEDLGKLSELEILSVQNVGLDEYPTVLLSLKSLIRLDLSNRSGIDISKNNIRELPVKLAETALEELLLHGNPMSKPPAEICDLGMHAIRSYLTDIIPGSQLISAETVNMLGDTGAGKTSIVRSLMNRRPCTTDAADRTRVMDQVTVRLLNEEFVNINDFGGHEIYQTVLPMFLPPKGIGILAYNMAESLEVQRDKVSRWTATVLAKSPGIRLIVAGTHIDLVSESDRLESERMIMGLMKEKFHAASEEIDSHLIKLKSELRVLKRKNASLDSVNAKITFLEGTLGALKSSKYEFVSLSCKEDAGASGLNKLHAVVSKNIKPSGSLPASWCHVMKDILQPQEGSLQTTSYLKWEQVEEIFDRHLPRETDGEKLKNLLRYLVATSQIIWLEGHTELGKLIFHRIGHVLDMCKAVLHHPGSTSCDANVPPMLKKEAQQYASGRLSGSFLQHLLRGYENEVADVMTNLMLQFNLISRVNDDGPLEQFVVPCHLPDTAPPSMFSQAACQGPLPTVLVRLHFFTSTVPLALFETSLSSVLSYVYKCKIIVRLWKDGIQYRTDKVTVSYLRIKDALEIMAITEGPEKTRDLWTVLHPVLKAVGDHVISMWKGAMPQCTFVCPACQCCGQHQSKPSNVRENVTLEELITAERPQTQHWYCETCRTDIPRTLMFPTSKEWITEEDLKDVALFMDAMRSKCPVFRESSTCGKQPNALKKRFRRAGKHLIDELDGTVADSMIDSLYAKGLINNEVKEIFEAKKTRTEKARYLCDIIHFNEEKVAETVFKLMECECNHLAMHVNECEP